MIKKINFRYLVLLLICLNGILLGKSAFAYEAYIPEEAVSSQDTTFVKESTQPYTEADLMCLARNVYYEAGSEPYLGKIAVAMVTLNRLGDPRFPKDICGVVNHKLKSRASGKWVCQFSWVCQKNKKIPVLSQSWESSMQIAKNILMGEFEVSGHKFKEIMFFHNTSVAPPSLVNLRRVMRIGNHYFYRG